MKKWLNNPNVNCKFNYLYKLVNKINGTIYYGVHRTNNLNDDYMGSGMILKRAKKKYGITNFAKYIIKFFKTYQEALDEEKKIVTLDFIKNNKTYNIKEGGYGNCKWSDAALKLLSDAAKKRWKNPEYVKMMENNCFNNDERNNKISKKVKKWIKENPELHRIRMLKINKNPDKIRKMAEKHKGMKRSEKAKQNISNAVNLFYKNNPDKAKIISGKDLIYIYNKELNVVKRHKKDEIIPTGWFRGQRPWSMTKRVN